MTLGPQVDLPQEVLVRLGVKVSEAVGRRIEIATAHLASQGANAATHRILVAGDGSRFSVKRSARIVQGDEKVRLVSRLAAVVDAPNHCAALKFEPVSGFGPFDNGDMNITEWLAPHAITVAEAISNNQVPRELPKFFQDFGELALFALVFGITDRGTHNWAWDAQTQRVCIIDEEDAFSNAQPSEFAWAFTQLANSQEWKSDPRGYGPASAFRSGLGSMQTKLRGHRAEFEQIIGPFPFASGFASKALQWIEPELDSLVSAFLACF